MSHFYGDDCAGGHWINAYVRSANESRMTAHTIRRVHPKGGWETFCGVRIERPTDDLEPMASDCYGCRTRRDR